MKAIRTLEGTVTHGQIATDKPIRDMEGKSVIILVREPQDERRMEWEAWMQLPASVRVARLRERLERWRQEHYPGLNLQWMEKSLEWSGTLSNLTDDELEQMRYDYLKEKHR